MMQRCPLLSAQLSARLAILIVHPVMKIDPRLGGVMNLVEIMRGDAVQVEDG